MIKISYLENYIFLTKDNFNTKYTNNFFMFIPEMTFSLTLSNRC